jgi:hypothetical protein
LQMRDRGRGAVSLLNPPPASTLQKFPVQIHSNFIPLR